MIKNTGTMNEQDIRGIITQAMEAVSVNGLGGRSYPNRLRPMMTHQAIQVACDLIIRGKTQADIAEEDRRILEEALRKREQS